MSTADQNRNRGTGKTRVCTWLLCLMLLLCTICFGPKWASAALVNSGAIKCGNQVVIYNGLNLILMDQPLPSPAVAVCEGALPELENALHLNFNSARANLWMGYAHLVRGDLAAATAALDRSADLQPGNSVAWLLDGIAYDRWGRQETALSRWGQIHDSARAITRLADRLAILQPPLGLEAADALTEALQRDPTNSVVENLLKVAKASKAHAVGVCR